jgi:hypothetical protein
MSRKFSIVGIAGIAVVLASGITRAAPSERHLEQGAGFSQPSESFAAKIEIPVELVTFHRFSVPQLKGYRNQLKAERNREDFGKSSKRHQTAVVETLKNVEDAIDYVQFDNERTTFIRAEPRIKRLSLGFVKTLGVALRSTANPKKKKKLEVLQREASSRKHDFFEKSKTFHKRKNKRPVATACAGPINLEELEESIERQKFHVKRMKELAAKNPEHLRYRFEKLEGPIETLNFFSDVFERYKIIQGINRVTLESIGGFPVFKKKPLDTPTVPKGVQPKTTEEECDDDSDSSGSSTETAEEE